MECFCFIYTKQYNTFRECPSVNGSHSTVEILGEFFIFIFVGLMTLQLNYKQDITFRLTNSQQHDHPFSSCKILGV